MDSAQNLQKRIQLARFKSATNVDVIQRNPTLMVLRKRLAKPRRLKVTTDEYHQLSPTERNKLKDGQGYVLGEVDGTRSNENVVLKVTFQFRGERVIGSVYGLGHSVSVDNGRAPWRRGQLDRFRVERLVILQISLCCLWNFGTVCQ